MSTPVRQRAIKSQKLKKELNQLKVIQGKKERNLTVLIYGLVVFIIFATLFVTVLGHALVAEQQIKIDNLNAQVSKLEQTHQSLTVKLAQAKAPSKIEQKATQLYNMAPPSTIIFLQASPVKKGSSGSGQGASNP